MDESVTSRAILFYDGHCGFCHRTVRLLLGLDRKGRLRFAPLQGKTASDLGLAPEGDPSTLILLDGRGLHLRSSGAIRALAHCGFPWTLALVFLLVPGPLRDLGYRALAKIRHRLFPPPDACALPSAGEKARFMP